jgi:hemerythrin
MNAEDRARKLCERAAASRDPDDLAEILAELRALMRQHFAHVEELIEEGRHRANRENKLGKSA